MFNNAVLGRATVQDYVGGEAIENINEQGISNGVANGVGIRIANGHGNLDHTNSDECTANGDDQTPNGDDHSFIVPVSVSSMQRTTMGSPCTDGRDKPCY